MSKTDALPRELLDASADSALGAVEKAGASADALVQAWVGAGNAAAVAEVAEHGSGAARKAARRGLNVLKSRGVKIPERGRTATLASSEKKESFEAWMMPPDTAGSTLIVVAAHAPASRYRAAFVVLHDVQGVQRIDVGTVSHSQLKESINRALPGAQYRPVSIPLAWARQRIANARKRHAERGVPEPLGFSSAASLLEPIADPPPPHPFDEEGLELADDDARDLAKDSVKLHSLPEFRGWFPTRAAIEEMLAKLGEQLTPGEQPDPEKMQERLDTEIVAATDRYFSPQRREELARAMKDSALSVLSREGEQKALEVAATIVCIQNRGLITDAPHELGFLKGYFEKAVSLLLAQGGGSLRIPVPNRPPTADAP
jgi:hypothetical protein